MPVTIEEASALALVGVGQGLKLDIRVAEDAAEAVIDKIQIQQVLLNLMRNAVEAMADSARRELTISARRAGDMVEISVADTGPGLPEQVRARLFQPFVTTKADGMGVGLSVCRAIVEAHGGELRCRGRGRRRHGVPPHRAVSWSGVPGMSLPPGSATPPGVIWVVRAHDGSRNETNASQASSAPPPPMRTLAWATARSTVRAAT